MTAGLTVAQANALLDTLGNGFTWVELHIGDPGAAGTANPSSVVTRIQITWNAAAAAAKTSSNTPSWGNWAGTSPETITHLAFWSLVTAGVFGFSILMPAPVTVQTGFPTTLPAPVTLTLTPDAA